VSDAATAGVAKAGVAGVAMRAGATRAASWVDMAVCYERLWVSESREHMGQFVMRG
jgi:hypothetical protein